MNLYLATIEGLVIAQRTGDGWRAVSQSLADKSLTCLAVSQSGVIYTGDTDGVYRSTDGGEAWHEWLDGLTVRHTRWMACQDERIFAGTEPAAIFVRQAWESAWRECPEVAALRDRHGWSLPYSPEAGCVRGFAFHGSRAYAAVEVGGALRSDDGGGTWQLCAGSSGDPSMDVSAETTFYPDVHSIEVHPSSPDLVYAPDGGGFYRSKDGGATWLLCYDCYVRAAWIDPEDPEHIVLGPADGVSRNGRIEESVDGGRFWGDASQGLDTPWRDHMVERFLQVDGELLAVLSNGELLATAPPLSGGLYRRPPQMPEDRKPGHLERGEMEWKRILPDVPDVNAAAWGR